MMRWRGTFILIAKWILLRSTTLTQAEITDLAELNAINAMTNTSNGPMFDKDTFNTVDCTVSPSSPGTGQFVNCDNAKEHILEIGHSLDRSFTLPPELGGLPQLRNLWIQSVNVEGTCLLNGVQSANYNNGMD